MTNPAHNALHDVHLFDHLVEKHRNRVRQAAQQSDAELIEDAIWHEIPKLVPLAPEQEMAAPAAV